MISSDPASQMTEHHSPSSFRSPRKKTPVQHGSLELLVNDLGLIRHHHQEADGDDDLPCDNAARLQWTKEGFRWDGLRAHAKEIRRDGALASIPECQQPDITAQAKDAQPNQAGLEPTISKKKPSRVRISPIRMFVRESGSCTEVSGRLVGFGSEDISATFQGNPPAGRGTHHPEEWKRCRCHAPIRGTS